MSEDLLRVPFPQRAGAALKDAFLQEALTIATTKFIDLRREAFEGFPQGDALRDRARSIKEATLQRLDHYLGLLADNVERLGGTCTGPPPPRRHARSCYGSAATAVSRWR